MARTLTKKRPEQGERIAEFRKAAGLSQAELARLIGESQQNVAFWEQSDKPPRSDVLFAMAQHLGVTVEDLLGVKRPGKKCGPVGKTQKVFEEVAKLPRRQQDKIIEIVSALLDQFRKKVS
jgi:transcriptional regulator with XRE-family HTH domain